MSDRREPIRDIAHFGYAELLTPKPEATESYFTDLLGMEIVRTEGDSIFLRGWGDYAVWTLRVTASDSPGIGRVGWRAYSEDALHRRVAAIEEAGLGIGWDNDNPDRGPTYRFQDPDGHRMEIYYEENKYRAPEGMKSALRNQPMRYSGRGAGVRRSDHVALLAKDVPANRAFAEETLGLQLREQIRFENGEVEIGSWLSSTAMHHEIAYVRDNAGMNGRLHHFSLWVDNREDVLRTADIFRENGIFIEAGPSKHNNSQAFYLYSYEPGGNRVEVYTSGFMVFAPDFEPVIWNEDNRDGGVYWGAKLPESFSTYATPPAPDQAMASGPVVDPH